MTLGLLVIITMAFALAASWTTHVVSAALFSDTVRANQSSVSQLAVRLEERVHAVGTDALYQELVEAARQMQGRLLVIDRDAKVILDTFDARYGTLASYAEVLSVLRGETDTDYGFHASQGEAGALSVGNAGWRGYFTAALLDPDGAVVGALLFVVSVQPTVDRLVSLRTRMAAMFALAGVLVLCLAGLLSGLLMRPVAALSAGIERMAKGDYGTPVHVRGRGELADLAASFNEMSEKVRRLDETRSQFVSNASHELKTPLATVKILVESMLYEDDMDGEVRREFLGDINREVDRLSSVVSDLLTLARIDSNKLVLSRTPMIFADVVEDTARRLRPLAERQGLNMRVQMLAPCEMEADASKLTQVCYNLIGNAIKYTPEGGEVLVKLSRSGRDAVLEVSDSGIGISAADLPHVFERFYRADKARTRLSETGGTGLGLSIVRQIVRLHAGTVTVKSELGKGSTFTVLLPCTREEGA